MEIKHFLLWLPMIALAFVNAALRELVFVKHFGEFRANQLSTVTLIVLCSIYVWLIFPSLDIQKPKQAFVIGFVWVLLTMAFEFSLGRLTGKSWVDLFRQYDLFNGRIWPVFLICLFLLPYLTYVLRSNSLLEK